MIDLLKRGQEMIAARGVWEQKQRLYYQMRHDGLRRRNKPWPTAADSHFPLIDMQIRKYKPFWLGQALASDRLATFISLREQLEPITESAADFFDFELKNRTQYTRKLRTAVDTMCLRGRGCLKVTVDPFNDYAIRFEAVDPIFILIGEMANDFGDSDDFVHVEHLSVKQYQADRRYDQDPETIRAIRGTKDLKLGQFWQDKELREGITHSRADDVIVLWSHYVKTLGGWTVYTYSPQAVQKEIRKPYGVPYKVQGKVSLPFFSFVMEVKDEGWYSPRGVAELCAPFEVYATKLWNEKADFMTFSNRPVLTSEKEIPNTANFRWAPGEFIPGGVSGVQFPQPPMSFDQEINFSRGTAEQLIMMPDFGVADSSSPMADKPRTATENNRIAQLQSVGVSDNGILFREDLSKVYRHTWGLMLQFKRAKLSYLAANQLKELPAQALHDEYLVMPAGATDEWDKAKRFQKAMTRLQTFRGAPNVDQDVLVKDALAADDPRLALKAFVPTAQRAADEAEQEAQQIVIMQDGFPAQVLPQQDHVTRIHVLLGWMMKQSQTGQPVDPIAQQRIHQHLAVHLQYLRAMNPQAARQIIQQIAQMERQPRPPGPGAQPPNGAAAPPQLPIGNPS